ncbi:MAG: DNA repair protein RadA, partial [Firmicutes bacterium]|nr:DNA repair protein RadA [Bacillota bacterium]
IPVFIVAHVTKSGELAGPKIVEHLVDTVLYFSGERTSDLRILRAVKNRFGPTSEIGAFEMREEGLVEIENISAAFLEAADEAASGSVCAAVYEGTRPLLLEVQALTGTCNVGFAMRRSVGIDSNRLSMIIAVLERKTGLKLFNRDVYVNVVGGFKPEGTSTDLAVALAIWSEEKGTVIPRTTLAVGELGLAGEVRAVQNCDKLIKEAERMGFKEVILPKRNLDNLRGSFKIKLTGVSRIAELLK